MRIEEAVARMQFDEIKHLIRSQLDKNANQPDPEDQSPLVEVADPVANAVGSRPAKMSSWRRKQLFVSQDCASQSEDEGTEVVYCIADAEKHQSLPKAAVAPAVPLESTTAAAVAVFTAKTEAARLHFGVIDDYEHGFYEVGSLDEGYGCDDIYAAHCEQLTQTQMDGTSDISILGARVTPRGTPRASPRDHGRVATPDHETPRSWPYDGRFSSRDHETLTPCNEVSPGIVVVSPREGAFRTVVSSHDS